MYQKTKKTNKKIPLNISGLKKTHPAQEVEA